MISITTVSGDWIKRHGIYSQRAYATTGFAYFSNSIQNNGLTAKIKLVGEGAGAGIEINASTDNSTHYRLVLDYLGGEISFYKNDTKIASKTATGDYEIRLYDWHEITLIHIGGGQITAAFDGHPIDWDTVDGSWTDNGTVIVDPSPLSAGYPALYTKFQVAQFDDLIHTDVDTGQILVDEDFLDLHYADIDYLSQMIGPSLNEAVIEEIESSIKVQIDNRLANTYQIPFDDVTKYPDGVPELIRDVANRLTLGEYLRLGYQVNIAPAAEDGYEKWLEDAYELLDKIASGEIPLTDSNGNNIPTDTDKLSYEDTYLIKEETPADDLEPDVEDFSTLGYVLYIDLENDDNSFTGVVEVVGLDTDLYTTKIERIQYSNEYGIKFLKLPFGKILYINAANLNQGSNPKISLVARRYKVAESGYA